MIKYAMTKTTRVSEYTDEVIPIDELVNVLDTMYLESTGKEMALVLYKGKKYIIPKENIERVSD